MHSNPIADKRINFFITAPCFRRLPARTTSADQNIPSFSERDPVGKLCAYPGRRQEMQRRISLQSQGKLPSRALGLPPGPLPHRDEIDHIVQVHADSQATVVARPMARENFDAPTTTPNDVDET